MARSVPEWIGKTADSKIPDRVKLRIWDREGGRCYLSGQKIRPGDKYDFEHVIAVALWTGEGHGNREGNIRLALKAPHKVKTAEDRAQQAKSDAVRKKHMGIRKAPTMRSAGFAKAPSQRRASSPITPKFDGDVLARKVQQ